MFIVTRYILREHVAPFLFGLLTIVFVFILNILFRDLGKLLGKGLPVKIILEFFFFNLAWIVALAIPMAVLLATLMAFGRFSSDNEITALKASGVHLYRLIAPVLMTAALLTIGMERFNNCVLPDFNHRVRLLYSDISRKRPTLALEPHVFFDDIPHYSLLVQDMEENSDLLRGIIINDASDSRYSRTIIAERGRMVFSEEQEKLILTLFNGEIHEVELENFENYRRLKFPEQRFSIPVPNMVLKRSESQHRGDREKSARMMKEDIQEDRESLEQRERRIRELVKRDLDEVFPEALWDEAAVETKKTAAFIYQRRKAEVGIRQLLQQIQAEMGVVRGYERAINALWVEIHKKYSIPVACIVFVLVGAPLGVMARQGGLATAGALSVVFFLIYWTFLIGGEQLADRDVIGPAVAMWAPNVLVGLGGVYLIISAVREATFIPWERWGRWVFRVWRRRKG